MNQGGGRLQVATLLALVAAMVALLMNTCAMDRLEKQVVRVAKSVERLESTGGGGGGPAVAAPAAVAALPGAESGFSAIGWGGRKAAITHVEGAAPGAPLTLGQKPRPQGDAQVNRSPSAPGSLSYYTTNEGTTGTITRYVLGKMLEVDPEAPPKVLPGLATRWEVSADKLTYTYHLRRGVQFADGRPFTSADVVFTWGVLRDPRVQADVRRGAFEDVLSLEAPDEYTVVVKYRRPYWKGLYTVGHELRILNKGWYEEMIPKLAERYEVAEFATEPGKPGFGEVFNKIRIPCPGTGPYYFQGEDYEANAPVELRQNPFSWEKQVRPTWWNLAKMRWIWISDPVAAFEAFRKGKFDVTVVDFQEWDDEYSKDPTITDIANYYEYDHMALGFSYIAWNTREAPFDDPRVRKAMAHLINRDWVVEEIERGRASVASCPSKPTYPMYPKLEPIPYDIEAARQLLAEAGWTDTDGDGVLDKDGKRFEYELKVGSTRRFYVQLGKQIEDASKKVGIRMSLRTLEWATFIEDYYKRRFQSVCLYASFPDPWIDSYESFHSSQDIPDGGNSTGWKNERVDALLEEMKVEFDDDARDAKYHEFCRIFQEEQPATLLVHGIVGVLQNKRFEDQKIYPTGLRAHEIWVKPENRLYD